jgi:hypothetical protein
MKDISLFLFVSALCRYHYVELLNIVKQLKTHVCMYVCSEFVASFLFFVVHKCVLSAAGKCLLLLHICYCWSKSMCFETSPVCHLPAWRYFIYHYMVKWKELPELSQAVQLWFVRVFKWSAPVGVLYGGWSRKICHCPTIEGNEFEMQVVSDSYVNLVFRWKVKGMLSGRWWKFSIF